MITTYLNRRLTPILLALLLLLPFTALAEDAPATPAETVCLQCHAGQPGHLGAPVGLWRDSVHAANGISCHDCHGGDPTDFAMAMSPERGFIGVPQADAIPAFCGRCHIGVQEDYLASKHGQALGKGGPQCVTCHGNHAVQLASLDLINDKDCTRCHTYERAAEIREALAATDARIASLDTELDRLHRTGITVKALKGEIFSQRNSFHRLFHSVDVNRVRAETAGVQANLDKVAAKIDTIHSDLSQRKLWGGVAIALLLVAGVLFILLRRTLPPHEQ